MTSVRRAVLASVLAAAVWAPSPADAGHRMSDRQAVRATVYKYLVRMGNLREGPHHDEAMDQALEEMALHVGPFPDLALEYLGVFLRNPEDDFDECTAAYGIPHFGESDPQQAVRVLTRGLPARNDAGDDCIGDAMRRLGPAAYEWLARCAQVKGGPENRHCLDALMAQSAHLPGAAAAVGDGPLEADASKARIQEAAGRWADWYERRADELEWDAETQLLREREP